MGVCGPSRVLALPARWTRQEHSSAARQGTTGIWPGPRRLSLPGSRGREKAAALAAAAGTGRRMLCRLSRNL